MGYRSEVQDKNLAWFLPRPKRDHYKGGMPLYAEEWLIELAQDILEKKDLKILTVFAGMSKFGVRVDLCAEVKPDYIGDVHKLTTFMPERDFDLVMADPPYSDEESRDLYGMPKLNYAKWTVECDKVLRPNGLFIIYHKLVPANPDPDKYFIEKRVFIGTRIWHLPRVAIVFRKKETGL